MTEELQVQPNTSFAIYLPFSKTEENDDGSLTIWGRATQELLDGQGETMDYQSSLPYWKKRMEEMGKLTDNNSLMPLREMHQPIAAGRVVQVDPVDADRAIDICAKVVDQNTINKVKEHVLNGFSVGGKYIKRYRDGMGVRYTADPHEISLVDVPAVPTAKLTLFKSQDAMPEDDPRGKLDVTVNIPSDPPAWFTEYTKATKELTAFIKAEQDKNDQQESKLKALGERVGISRRKGSPKTPPKDYPDDPSEYGDPANFNFPTDEARHVQAVGRFNGGQGKDQYSLHERHAVGRRIARLASRFGDQYSYDRSKQQIVNAKEKTTMDDKLKKDLLAFRDQVEDKEAFDALVSKMAGPTDPSQPITIEDPAVKVPGASVAKVDGKKAPAPTTSTMDGTTSTTTSTMDGTTSTTTTPEPKAKAAMKAEDSDAIKALDTKINKTLEAVAKLGDAVTKLADLKKGDGSNDPINDLNAIITSEMNRRMPLEGDEVIKALEANDMYSLQKALHAAGSDSEDKFMRKNAMNEVFTKMRKATLDELATRGFTADNMIDSHFRPLPQ